MKVVIIEDEKPAAKRLERLITQLKPDAEILVRADSVKSAVEWFTQCTLSIDVAFFDIQLADGLSFEIFDLVKVDAPIIFTTAYDEYALKAFKTSAIDYLLKPIDTADLSKAFDKLSKYSPEKNSDATLERLKQAMTMLHKQYKSRFLVKIGEHIKIVNVEDIAYFHSKEKVTYCTTYDGKQLILDQTLQQVRDSLNPDQHYQINRQFIISVPAITDIISYSNSRLRLVLDPKSTEEVIVSRDRVQEFKTWLDR